MPRVVSGSKLQAEQLVRSKSRKILFFRTHKSLVQSSMSKIITRVTVVAVLLRETITIIRSEFDNKTISNILS